jgi:hypothetical protein
MKNTTTRTYRSGSKKTEVTTTTYTNRAEAKKAFETAPYDNDGNELVFERNGTFTHIFTKDSDL